MALSLIEVINDRIDAMRKEITKHRAELPDWWVDAAEETVTALVTKKEELRRELNEN
jgi:hypothetical protein